MRPQAVPPYTLLSMTATEDLELIRALADAADGISLPCFRAGAVPAETKPDGSPVTAVDREVERAVRARLGAARPDEPVIGEELGGRGAAARRWIVDPIDGTANFVAGRAEWSTLLAVEADGEIVTGMISAPALGRRWWATRAAGAWTGPSGSAGAPGENGAEPGECERLRVSAVARLDAATVAIWPLGSWVPPERMAAGRRLIESGAGGGPLSDWAGACHGAALVAAGVVDVFFHMTAGAWDIAAAVPIVEEAGGTVSDLAGGRNVSAGAALYSNGAIHREVLEMLGSMLPG